MLSANISGPEDVGGAAPELVSIPLHMFLACCNMYLVFLVGRTVAMFPVVAWVEVMSLSSLRANDVMMPSWGEALAVPDLLFFACTFVLVTVPFAELSWCVTCMHIVPYPHWRLCTRILRNVTDVSIQRHGCQECVHYRTSRNGD
jgi:hypothetical protein